MSLIGIDVHAARGCVAALLEPGYQVIDVQWFQWGQVPALCQYVQGLGPPRAVAIGIDAPRAPLAVPRQWYWRGGQWHPRVNEAGYGRHCELIVNAFNLATPQWTPPIGAWTADWMTVGFELFATLQDMGYDPYEVFPAASYRLLEALPGPTVSTSLGWFSLHRTDVLDAIVAAVTVGEYLDGNGAIVGNGDGAGSIILPQPLPDQQNGVLEWPPPPAEAP